MEREITRFAQKTRNFHYSEIKKAAIVNCRFFKLIFFYNQLSTKSTFAL